ncbi:ABC transporter ATP-binding protein [Nocardia sp. NBC_00881]|uniref:ABC transporter ATP-binding protein n=1 Tax=Nocardia sp. NBC_00881 TaxID=2975995 RepID=UPI0038663046|nr:ABC transporter ATP-binding protein [Nocardia sp. NBC_00881]
MTLQCRELIAGHGRIPVVRGINIELYAGEVLAVLGPNGAGKTTLLSTLAGLLPRLAGHVRLDGQTLPSGKPARANRAGIVLVPDDRALFAGLTVADNLRIARRRSGPPLDQIIGLFPALETRWSVAAAALSGGEQQMLALARALVQEPKVLLIDEMSTGLAPVIVENMLPAVRRIAEETGTRVVMVEQHVRLALEIADEALVLVHGDVTFRGAAATLARDPGRIEAAYLGGMDPGPVPSAAAQPSRTRNIN